MHCHTPWLIPFGATEVPLRAMFGLAGFIAEGMPVFEIRKTAGMTDLLIRDPARGRRWTDAGVETRGVDARAWAVSQGLRCRWWWGDASIWI